MAGTGSPAVKVAKKCQVAPAFCDKDSEEKWMDVDDEGASQASPALSRKHACRVSSVIQTGIGTCIFDALIHSLQSNISAILTFLATITKHAEMLSIMERSIPWHDLAQFFANPPPHNIFTTQGLVIPTAGCERWSMLTSGCAPPLSKDWCLSGMEWIS
ncbi:hypothetical protein F4604DRAFT_1931686 [Suillus subluteus]|nr:hypothetical protein F4604DRAFT_1931686 [Suillus subluteus]